MLRIENGRFSECVFVDDLKGKNIDIKQYRNQDSDISGLIVGILPNPNGYKIWIDINGYPNIITSYNLHNIENANIF